MRSNQEYSKIENLQGLRVSEIDDLGDSVLITTECGRQFLITHNQQCCENVFQESVDGKWESLIGKVIVHVSQSESPGDDDDGLLLSQTNTTIILAVDDSTVISRWVGTSNGYYSERVDILELFE